MRKKLLLQADVRNNKGKDCGIKGGGQQGKGAWFKEEMSERSLAEVEVGTNKRKERS